VVRRAAQRHALVLTTHSLEEAEALCERIGVFVAGQLRCVGTPQELTARWGGWPVGRRRLQLGHLDKMVLPCLATEGAAGCARRYGGCLTLSLTTPPAQEGLAQAAVAAMCPSARLSYCLAGTQTFELPVGDIGLAQVFGHMQALEEGSAEAAGGDSRPLQVLNWGVSSATLEQVFLRVVARAALADQQPATAAQR
jgi:hypothetical protein